MSDKWRIRGSRSIATLHSQICTSCYKPVRLQLNTTPRPSVTFLRLSPAFQRGRNGSKGIIHRIRNVSDENVAEQINLCSIFFLPENRAVYEIMWRNVYGTAGQTTDDNIIRRIRFFMLDN